ncbi:MAG: permease-like cell division protein FtsX, partial [Marinobacter sp.]|uniref:cell division protein FtsX n=1 Tax=Marinobacter sp. TaxID=50741 RepID=UPI003297AFDB
MAADQKQKPDNPRGAATRSKSPINNQARSYLDHHRKVARASARRLLKAPVASLMTWTVMGVALALPVALLLLLTSLQGVSAGWESSARVTAYLELELPEDRARELREEIASDGRVTEVELVSRDQALAEFRTSSGLKEALDYLDDNPLPHTLLITPEQGARSQAGVEGLVSFIQAMNVVERV